ncbi:MAG TPA: ribosome small subunit-dependent GTPase A [Bacteroidales bacterium]|nr:ribosome small subunit-dependent GTPase A [Bacteroidales bacterium]
MPTGMVVKSTGSWYMVSGTDGVVVPCRLRGRFRMEGLRTTNPLAVGDKVVYEMEPGKSSAVVTNILPRSNVIIRKATRLSSAAHIIAANLDYLMLIATIAQPRTSTGFIDRFLATAEAYHIPAAIAFNKTDLLQAESDQQLRSLTLIYESAGYPVLHVSAHTGSNLEALAAFLHNKVVLFSGHSGVGKTALINRLIPGINLRTGQISDKHQKGRHTTTFAEAIALPGGGWIVDTPGIKEFGLYDLEKETLAQRFPEMRRLMPDCRFANCTHIHEPGCAVKQAVANHQLASTRYQNYVNMMFNDYTNDN